MKIERSSLNMLGIEIGRNKSIKEHKNVEQKISKLTRLLYIHSRRDLSLC